MDLLIHVPVLMTIKQNLALLKENEEISKNRNTETKSAKDIYIML